MTRSFVLLAGLAALAGCPDATDKDSGDSGTACTTTTPGATFIADADVSCDATDNVTILVNTTGWVQEGGPDNEFYAIDSANNSSWSESHPIDSNGNRDACGAADQLELTMPTNTYPATEGVDFYVPGVSSFFSCDAHYSDAAVMNYAVAIDDANGVYADCFAFGHDPQGLVDGDYSGAGATPGMDLSLCTPATAR